MRDESLSSFPDRSGNCSLLWVNKLSSNEKQWILLNCNRKSLRQRFTGITSHPVGMEGDSYNHEHVPQELLSHPVGVEGDSYINDHTPQGLPSHHVGMEGVSYINEHLQQGLPSHSVGMARGFLRQWAFTGRITLWCILTTPCFLIYSALPLFKLGWGPHICLTKL